MRNSTRTNGRVTIGLDLGDKHGFFHILAHDGEMREEGRIRMTPDSLKCRFESIAPARVAIETGTHSPWVSRLLEDCGHEVLVANSRQLRLIYENKNKSDRVDAEYLARIARLDPGLLKPVKHRGARAQRDLAALRAREALVATRTKLVNHVRGAVKSFGGRVAASSTATFHKKALASIPQQLHAAMTPLVELIGAITAKIKQFDKASLITPPEDLWLIRRDGGDFDQLTGASITPRAVIKAIKETLLYFNANRDTVFAIDETANGDSER